MDAKRRSKIPCEKQGYVRPHKTFFRSAPVGTSKVYEGDGSEGCVRIADAPLDGHRPARSRMGGMSRHRHDDIRSVFRNGAATSPSAAGGGASPFAAACGL